MTDPTPRTGAQTPEPDEDRLLARALGLEDDSSPSQNDDESSLELESVDADVAAIVAGIRRIVPAPDADYTDLDDERWRYLRDELSRAERRPRRDRATPQRVVRWLRLVAPVAAAIAVLAVGASVLTRDNTGVGNSTETLVEREVKRAPSSAEDATGRLSGSPASFLDAGQTETYGVVLVVRARTVHNGAQRFDVVRVLRGEAPDGLSLGIVTASAEPGSLNVLCLTPDDAPIEPGSTSSPQPATDATSTAGPSPSPSRLKEAAGSTSLVFDEAGKTALLIPLPADVNPDDIVLP
ncbi:MAG: hypothetical protein R2826_04075 [Thermoleophilia bacterium]